VATPAISRILAVIFGKLVALEALADAVKAPKQPLRVGVSKRPDIPNGTLNPSGAIISDEGATAGGGVHRFAANMEPHDHLALTGGAIGQGIPVATGAAVCLLAQALVAARTGGLQCALGRRA
jgi:acetolactate synthase-1/2/3 large subunit